MDHNGLSSFTNLSEQVGGICNSFPYSFQNSNFSMFKLYINLSTAKKLLYCFKTSVFLIVFFSNPNVCRNRIITVIWKNSEEILFDLWKKFVDTQRSKKIFYFLGKFFPLSRESKIRSCHSYLLYLSFTALHLTLYTYLQPSSLYTCNSPFTLKIIHGVRYLGSGASVEAPNSG